jgi:ATP-dependent DNA ligase
VVSPPVFMAFDLLYRDGRDFTLGRRARLEDAIPGGDLVFPRAPARG